MGRRIVGVWGLGVLSLLVSGMAAAYAETDMTVERSQTEVRQDFGADESVTTETTVETEYNSPGMSDEPIPSGMGQADAGWSQAEKLDWSDWGVHPHLAGPLGLSTEFAYNPLESVFERSSGAEPAMYGGR